MNTHVILDDEEVEVVPPPPNAAQPDVTTRGAAQLSAEVKHALSRDAEVKAEVQEAAAQPREEEPHPSCRRPGLVSSSQHVVSPSPQRISVCAARTHTPRPRPDPQHTPSPSVKGGPRYRSASQLSGAFSE